MAPSYKVVLRPEKCLHIRYYWIMKVIHSTNEVGAYCFYLWSISKKKKTLVERWETSTYLKNWIYHCISPGNIYIFRILWKIVPSFMKILHGSCAYFYLHSHPQNEVNMWLTLTSIVQVLPYHYDLQCKIPNYMEKKKKKNKKIKVDIRYICCEYGRRWCWLWYSTSYCGSSWTKDWRWTDNEANRRNTCWWLTNPYSHLLSSRWSNSSTPHRGVRVFPTVYPYPQPHLHVREPHYIIVIL